MSGPLGFERDKLTTCLYAAKTTMLSVGSGDGSQQAAIVRSGHTRLLTTFFDEKRKLLQKYPHAESTLEYLEKNSFERPRFGIDASKLHTYKNLGKFDLIFFTFPHTGVPNHKQGSVESNKRLLRDFLKSAQSLLKQDGEIQITLKAGSFYDKWQLETLNNAGLRLSGKHVMDKSLFPGYKHRLTNGMSGALKEVPEKNGATVHVFARPTSPSSAQRSSAYFSGKLLTIVQPPDRKLWTEEEAWAEVVEILEKEERPRNVLEIRRTFPCLPHPDARQLNRVLYKMNEVGVIKKHPPNGTACKKPCWSLK